MARASISPEQWAVARAQWEGDPSVTFGDIAENLGTSRQAVQLQSKRKGWQRRLALEELAVRAQEEADANVTHFAPRKPESEADVYVTTPEFQQRAPIARELPSVPVGLSSEQAVAAVTQQAVDKRAEVLTTHRKEWVAVRGVAYKALKSKDMVEAKVSKILAEAVKVLQDGERRAWGLDGEPPKPGQPGASVQVLVNRRSKGQANDR